MISEIFPPVEMLPQEVREHPVAVLAGNAGDRRQLTRRGVVPGRAGVDEDAVREVRKEFSRRYAT